MVLYNNSIFDPITNSEKEMVMRARIPEAQAPSYLRAYIIIRLLFSREFVITDSSINLNRALRTLILREEGGLHYDDRMLPDADFAQLLEDGTIKLAARDEFKGNFSKRLRDAQRNKKYVDLPSKKYVDFIDEICKEKNIYWWNTDEVTRMFTRKIRKELESEYSDEVNMFLRELRCRLADQETLTFDAVKKEARKMRSEDSEEYKIVHDLLRKSYDYNVPEILNLDYFRFLDSAPRVSKEHNFEVDKVEEYDIPWTYGFNLNAFSLFPVEWLKDFRESSEHIRYEEAMSQYQMGLIEFGQVLDALTDYLRRIDQFITPFYNSNKHVVDPPKNLMIRFQEAKDGKHPLIVATAVGVWASSAVMTAHDLLVEPTLTNTLKLMLTTILPNIVFTGYEHYRALPKINHAIVKLDK